MKLSSRRSRLLTWSPYYGSMWNEGAMIVRLYCGNLSRDVPNLYPPAVSTESLSLRGEIRQAVKNVDEQGGRIRIAWDLATVPG